MAYAQVDEEIASTERTYNGADEVAKQGRLQVKPSEASQDANPNFPPPKTDKPRPHICTTCTRAFARLEHLKRHERSHTKEKPFACNECTRCFARRDLLLRHQQKLHMTAPPTSRSRRRESTSSTTVSGSTRVRKNSTVNNPAGLPNGTMRPRANTISHIDNAAFGLMPPVGSNQPRPHANMEPNHAPMSGLPGVGNYHYRGMSSASGHHGNAHGLPKLETKNRFVAMNPGLRTAPPHGSLMGEMHQEASLFGQGHTINPAQLHFTNSPQAMGFDSPLSPLQHSFSGVLPGHHAFDADNGVGWLHSFDHQMSFHDEQAIDNSSPSAVDSASPGTMDEMILDSHSNPISSGDWHQPKLAQTPVGQGYPFDMSSQQYMDIHMNGPLSPKDMAGQMLNTEQFFTDPSPFPSKTPHQMFDGNPFMFSGTSLKSETPSNSTASISSSNRQSSVTSASTDSISDATRQALINSLSEPLVQSHSYSKTSASQASMASGFLGGPSVPSTQDLQRYVAAYTRYFNPHLPFLHLPTLSFDAPAFTNDLSANDQQHPFVQDGTAGGGGSLILAMASIGALYEYDFRTSKDLSEMSKQLIQLYLQQRSTMDFHGANTNGTSMDSQSTPLWLVQAMLLNVVYGHNSGDKKAASIANTQCASLISLARSADLAKPAQAADNQASEFQLRQNDLQLNGNESTTWSGYISHPALELEKTWQLWKLSEERKRTLYAIFIFSSLLVSAYDSAPALMNSEILLDLPCDERLWTADSADAWQSLGGSAMDQQDATSFGSALSFLLGASQRKQQKQRRMSQPLEFNPQLESVSEGELRPSTFGCLVLINALHNYIWETRQHHSGRQWTPQDTEKMHAHMEPALRAWQAAWSSNSDHSLERPNPFGASSMSADCIPLLDLAYVRLFVNLGRSKELFFRRDWDSLADELANGSDIVQHSEHSPPASPQRADLVGSAASNGSACEEMEDSAHTAASNEEPAMKQCSSKCSKRERHLRKAAYCAANSLMMSDRLNVTFADFNSRELPLQSALCAFDCAQILAEWISTVQQRVGRYVGILGKDNIDLSEAPACMFLEDDDCKLLEKVKEILKNAEGKLSGNANIETMTDTGNDELGNCGYGSKLLSIHARMFEREAVWPVCHEMSLALRTQARHIKAKTENSVNVST